MKYPVYNNKNKKDGEINLKKLEIPEEINTDLLHQVVESLRSRRRQIVAKTKDRSEVSGGGRKPWAQKGTGRARHGSIRSPIWVGGGVTFGPQTNRNYKKKINRKMKRKAFQEGFLTKIRDKELKIVDKLELSEIKTKLLSNLLDKLELTDQSVLILLGQPSEEIKMSARNLPRVDIRTIDQVNVLDVLSYHYILIAKDSFNKLLEKRLLL